MTLFTDSPYEKMMIQKPEDGKRDKSPPASFSPRCAGCPYRGQSPCIGYSGTLKGGFFIDFTYLSNR